MQAEYVWQPPDPELFGRRLFGVAAGAVEPLAVGQLLNIGELLEAVCNNTCNLIQGTVDFDRTIFGTVNY